MTHSRAAHIACGRSRDACAWKVVTPQRPRHVPGPGRRQHGMAAASSPSLARLSCHRQAGGNLDEPTEACRLLPAGLPTSMSSSSGKTCPGHNTSAKIRPRRLDPPGRALHERAAQGSCSGKTRWRFLRELSAQTAQAWEARADAGEPVTAEAGVPRGTRERGRTNPNSCSRHALVRRPSNRTHPRVPDDPCMESFSSDRTDAARLAHARPRAPSPLSRLHPDVPKASSAPRDDGNVSRNCTASFCMSRWCGMSSDREQQLARPHVEEGKQEV